MKREWRWGPITTTKFVEIETETFQTAIHRVKGYVEKDYDSQGFSKREWLAGSPPDSDESKDYRVTVFVREGSPPKGFVIASGLFVLGMDLRGTPIVRATPKFGRWKDGPGVL